MLAERKTPDPGGEPAKPRPARPLVAWSQGLSIGVESIDSQHLSLVEMVNAIHADLQAEKTNEDLLAAFRRLAEFTALHFRHEEELMQRTQYPFADTHSGCHAGLLQSLQTYERDINRDCSPNAMRAHLQMLRDWLVRHIKGQDMELGYWLNRDGPP